MSLDRRPWRTLVVLGSLAALTVTSCSPQEGQGESEGLSAPSASPTSDDAESTTPDTADNPTDDELEEATEPQIVTDEDGFLRANTLPEAVAEQIIEVPQEGSDSPARAKAEILSLDSDGDFARAVIAWLPPEDGEFVGSDLVATFRARAQATPYIRVVDREAQELLEPLYAESRSFRNNPPQDGASPDPEMLTASDALNKMSDACVCTGTTNQLRPDTTHLMYVDFPAPESDSVDILLSEAFQPVRDVKVTSNNPFEMPEDELSRFVPRDHHMSETYGTGAESQRRLDIASRSASLTGLTTTEDGEVREVSLPADVLFEFGESSLSSQAEAIIRDAAEKLNTEAAGQSVVVEGHTDNVDSHELNQDLSEDRADAVAEVLEPMLDDDIILETEGHSYDRPLVPNEDADGNDLPQNRELNRRVSFRYTYVEESDVTIDLGFEELEDLEEAEETDAAEDALASYILPVPEEDRTEQSIRLDITGAERHGETVTMTFGLAIEDGELTSSVIAGSSAAEDPQLFGKNSYSSNVDAGLGNIGLVDLGAEQQYFPVTASPFHCLCSEVPPLGTALSSTAAPLYAEFALPDDVEGPFVLRIPDSAQIELPQDVAQSLTGG